MQRNSISSSVGIYQEKNLLHLILFKIYNKVVLQTPALVVEKDAVFIPAGWDKDKKIAILYENMHR